MSHLSKPGDPYIANGKVVAKPEEADNLKKGERLIPVVRRMPVQSRRNMNEMPAQDRSTQMAINCILVYHLAGLTDNEIAHTTGLTLADVQNIKFGSDYQATFEMIFNELISVNSNSIRAKLADYSSKALDQVIELAESADKDIVRLKANQDILDRAGFSPEAIFGEGDQQDTDMLKIVIEGANGPSKTNININLKGLKK